MDRQKFMDGIIEIQENFGSKYNDSMKKTIFDICSKWRDSTFKSVIEYLKQEFKKSYGVDLPYPKDYKDAIYHIHREEEKTWKKEILPEQPADLEGYMIYKKAVSDLMKKLGKSERFRLRTAHIDGVFACEVCFRSNCNGSTPEKLRKNSGCAAFLSEEKLKEIEEIKKQENIDNIF